MYGCPRCRTVFGRARTLIPWIPPEILDFPPVEEALDEPNGLLCAGGDLSVERLTLAYRRGIFPWFSTGEPILWWSPGPRLVLKPANFRLRKSLRQSIKKQQFQIRVNADFDAVMHLCASTRERSQGTWITPAMQDAYSRLNQSGFGFCAATWIGSQLVGGLYGVQIGRVLFGESMVSLVPDASKAALAEICQQSDQHQIALIDCQVPTSHLQSLGASLISRSEFIEQVALHIP